MLKSKIFVLTLFIVLESCEKSDQEVLFFGRERFSDLVQLELGLGSLIDTLYKDIPVAFKPQCLKSRTAVKVLRSTRLYAELPLIAQYYFDHEHNLIFIHYEWSQSVPGLSYRDREEIMQKEVRCFDKYSKKLELLAQFLNNEMGEPEKNDGKMVQSKTSLMDFSSYKLKFKKENKVVDLSLIWSPKKGARFFKVFTKIYWE